MDWEPAACDLHAHGKDAVGFYTEQKVVMSRWF
jgi:hypothetical protein